MARQEASISLDVCIHVRHVFAPRLWLLGWMPRRVRTQAILAEMLSQALASGMNIVEAIEAASEAMRGCRLQELLRRIAGMVRRREEVADSFRWAGIPLHANVQAAMEVGEAWGSLDTELAAAARLLDPQIPRHVAMAIGRRKSANQFAAALARLLSQQPMTVDVVRDAARLVGGRDRRFRRVIRWLALDVEGGSSLAEALMRYPDIFDPLFVRCVAHAQSRESMRHTLSRLCGEELAASSLPDRD